MTTIGTVNGFGKPVEAVRLSFTIKSLDGESVYEVRNAQSHKQLHLSNMHRHIKRLKKEWSHLEGIPVISVDFSDVTVLIGSDVVAAHEVLEYRKIR